MSACGYSEACGARDTVSNEIFNDNIELNCYGIFFNIRKIIHVDCLVYFPYIILWISTKDGPACCCTSTLAFTTVLLPESSEIINPRGSQLKPHVTKEKSYFRHTHPGLQSLVPSLSPLLVRFLRVCLQDDSSRLLVTTAACKHQSCFTQSSSKR